MENSSKLVSKDITPSGDFKHAEDEAIKSYANQGITNIEQYLEDEAAESNNTPAGRLHRALEARYDISGVVYSQNDQNRYDMHTTEIITKLSDADMAFASMDDAAREVFGKGVAAALYNHSTEESKTTALREVISLYRESHAAQQNSIETPEAVEENTHETSPDEKRAKLGKFSLSRMYWYAHARMAESAEKSYEKYSAKEDDSRAKRIGKYIMRNKVPLAMLTMMSGSAASKWAVETGALHDLIPMPSNYDQAHEIVQQSDIRLAANANIIVPTNGRGGGNMPNAVPLLGALGGKNAHIEGVTYPGAIQTLVTPEDSHTLDQSVTIASNKQYDIYEKNPGQKITYVGYSEGGVTQTVTEARIRKANGGELPANVHFVYIGTPGVEGGASENPYWDAIPAAIKKSQGIESFGNKSEGGPNVHYYKNESDFWAAASSASPIDMADKAIGTAFGGTHGAYGGNIPSTTERNTDGSLTTTYHGGNNVVNGYRLRSGIANALYQNQHIPVTKEMDEAILAMRGDENGNYNAAKITDTLAKAAERQQPGTGNFVRTALGPVLSQELVDAATNVQNAAPKAIAEITNPGASMGGTTELSTALTDGVKTISDALTGHNTAPSTEVATAPAASIPAYTAPSAPVLNNTAPAQMQQPIQQFTQQAAPIVEQFTAQVEKAVPQLAPQIAQGKAALSQFGIRLP